MPTGETMWFPETLLTTLLQGRTRFEVVVVEQAKTVPFEKRRLTTSDISPVQGRCKTPLTSKDARFLHSLLNRGLHFPTRRKSFDEILTAVGVKQKSGASMVAERLSCELLENPNAVPVCGRFEATFTQAERAITKAVKNFSKDVAQPCFLQSLWIALSNNNIAPWVDSPKRNMPHDKIWRAVDLIDKYGRPPRLGSFPAPMKIKVKRAVKCSLSVLGVTISDDKLGSVVDSLISHMAGNVLSVYEYLAIRIDEAIHNAVHPPLQKHRPLDMKFFHI